MNGAPARRPGGTARLLLLVCAAAGFFEVFSIGFPPASRDRLPVLLEAVALGLLAAWDREKGLFAFAVLFPLAGFGDRAFGGADAIAWPLLLFLGLAVGWTFRFLYDFESAPEPSRLDRGLKAVLAVWSLATLAAIVAARTLWAIFRGLRLRAVNVDGLLDTAAIRESLLSFAALACGAAFFFVLRRSGAAARERTLLAALAGTGLSAAVALGERIGIAPGETSAFWKLTGRMSGGAMDPNALGILCGLAACVAATLAVFGSRRRAAAAGLALLLVGGLALSGSRSGLGLLAVGLLVLLSTPGLPAKRRLGAAGLCAVLVLGAAWLLFSGPRGDVGSRVAEVFDPRLTVERRASSRPILWRSALRLFERHPVAGAGLGSFSWQLPNLLREEGRSLALRDNPGNAYLQALAETGVIGFLLFAVFAVGLARESAAALRGLERSPLRAGAGAASIGMLAVLAAGSHWFAPDVALLFFLLASLVARESAEKAVGPLRRAGAVLLGAYAVAVILAALRTLDPEETFRFRPGIGFYSREVGPGGAFYWTQRRFALRLRAGQSLRMDLARFAPEGKPVELTAESEGRVVFSRTLSPGQVLRVRLAGAGARPRVVRFALSRSFVPRRFGLSGDRRELGLVAVFPGAE